MNHYNNHNNSSSVVSYLIQKCPPTRIFLYLTCVVVVVVTIYHVIRFDKPMLPSDQMIAMENSLLHDEKHGIKMGVLNSACDDGRTNLSVDWCQYQSIVDSSLACSHPFGKLKDLGILTENYSTKHRYVDDHVPENRYPQHFCMNQSISYEKVLPTYGDHRPIWPIFGEYVYVPPQRWLHSVEHGAVILLYHPNVDIDFLQKAKEIVKSCIRKHIISADVRLDLSRPLALVTWSNSMEMGYVDDNAMKAFIRSKGLHGPEGRLSKEGQYDVALIRKASIPHGSTIDDSVLCPVLTNEHQDLNNI